MLMNLKVAYRRYRREFLHPLRTAHGEWKAREGFIVRMESGDAVGYGEIAPIPDFGTETIERAESFLEQWGSDPIIMPSGLPCCNFALTAAQQQCKMPACEAVRDYAVAGLLPAGTNALATAKKKFAEGYTSLKWKVGVHSFEAEKEVFDDLLALLPETVTLRLDANGGLNMIEFERWLEALAPHASRIEYFEQPLAPGEELVMAEMSEASGIQIALDESLNRPDRERWLTPEAWNGPLVIKPLLMGNVTLLMEQLRPLAKQLVFSSVFETGVGLSHALSLADYLPDLKYAIGFDTLSAFNDSLCGLDAKPVIMASDRAKIDPDALWNQLAPLT